MQIFQFMEITINIISKPISVVEHCDTQRYEGISNESMFNIVILYNNDPPSPSACSLFLVIRRLQYYMKYGIHSRIIHINDLYMLWHVL